MSATFRMPAPDPAAFAVLDALPDLAPAVRTNGLGLPDYGAGWFRLAGGARALAFVTDRARLVHVPTDRGYALLVSVDDPDGLVAALRALGRAGADARAA